jgi:aryl-alcohol dehydrogenase-like predicted oxidoreductase
MQKVKLGNTKLLVSKLCFGTLPMGLLEANMPLKKGAELIRKAVLSGVNFIDTAHTYGTYRHIFEAKKGMKIKPVIATKTAAVTISETKRQIEKAIKELGVDKIDIFLIHAAREIHPFEKFKQTLKILLQYKSKNLIGYVGIATHVATVVKEAAKIDDMDIIHPLINSAGLGIINGTLSDMKEAINTAHRNGKGIYVMKSLGG